MRTLIVGGGPAGLTLAIALRRHGIEVDLLEASRGWEVLGAGLSLGGAPLRALSTVGLAERCVAAGFGSTTLAIGNANGEVVQLLDRPRLNGPDYPASLGIMRPELHRLLAVEAVRSGAAVQLGTTVRSLTQRARTVAASLSDGSSSEYDLVVGADGLHSAVRSMVFGEREQPRFTGQAVWRATLQRPDEVTGPAMYYGPHNKAGLTPGLAGRDVPVPGRERGRRPALAARAPGGAAARTADRLSRRDRRVARADRRQRASRLPAASQPAAIASVVPRARAPDRRRRAFDDPPHLAAGAGLAIEDAIVLAELFGAGTAIPDALAAFMSRRYERCRTIVESSLQLGEWEKRPGSPDAGPVGVSTHAWSVLAQPI